jgi:4'-phosphopantetheinyl transferase
MERGEVHLWLARPDRVRAPALVQACLDLLSPEERARLAGLRLEARRHEYLVTRALVRTILSRYGASRPADWRFTQNAHGRPELDPPGRLRFNLSNSPGLVGCAVALHEVGLDLEPHPRAVRILRLAARVFSAEERRALADLPEAARAGRALALWTLKEAYLKARGTGISLPLQELTFSPASPVEIALALGTSIQDDPARWHFRLLEHGGHGVAVAVDAPVLLRAWETVPLVDGSDRALELGDAG